MSDFQRHFHRTSTNISFNFNIPLNNTLRMNLLEPIVRIVRRKPVVEQPVPNQSQENANRIFEEEIIVPTIIIPKFNDNVDKRLYFNDLQRKIDFVFVHKKRNAQVFHPFLDDVHRLGLTTESEAGHGLRNLTFVKVNCDSNKLKEFATIYNIDLAMNNPFFIDPTVNSSINFQKLFSKNLDDPVFLDRAKELLESPKTFTNAERILITERALSEIEYEAMIKNKIIIAAYPLHDGAVNWTKHSPLNDRQLLYKYWARNNNIFQPQPTTAICKYFGPEVGFYFAFIDFFNQMLIPLAVIGILVLLICIFLIFDYEIKDFCKSDRQMCPTCTEFERCPFYKMQDYCILKLTLLLADNLPNAVFSVGVAFWSAFFYVFWKRKESVLKLYWHVDRMKYESTLIDKNDCYDPDGFMRRNSSESRRIRTSSAFTKKQRSFAVFMNLANAYLMTLITFILMLVVVIASIILAMLYRTIIFRIYQPSPVTIVFTNVSGCLFHFLLLKFVLLPIFMVLAYKMTSIEKITTVENFEKAVVLKICLLSIPAYFGPIVYIGVFRGKFYRHPKHARDYFEYGIFPIESCNPAGCMFDVSIHVFTTMLLDTIYMFGKLGLRALQRTICTKIKHREFPLKEIRNLVLRFEKDYVKFPNSKKFLILQYRDLMIEYLMVICFTCACPLLPLFALIRNVIRIRLDSYMYLKLNRRVVPRRIPGIVAWNKILIIITFIGFLVNALLLAFSSLNVRRMYYLCKKMTMEGFINNIFMDFATTNYGKLKGFKPSNVTLPENCHYGAISLLTDDDTIISDRRTGNWMHLSSQIIFVITFENVMLLLMGICYYSLPSKPNEVIQSLEEEDMIFREDKLTKLFDEFEMCREQPVHNDYSAFK